MKRTHRFGQEELIRVGSGRVGQPRPLPRGGRHGPSAVERLTTANLMAFVGEYHATRGDAALESS